jgi:hypothetical protein
VAAKHRGATVVAFEPGFAAYERLCRHLLLNACDGTVIPVPLAVSDFEGMGELKFAPGRAGDQRHSLQGGPWKPRRHSRVDRTMLQATCVTTVDEAFHRYGWPAPNHLRLSTPASAAAILAGACGVLALPAMRTVFLTVLDEHRAPTTQRLLSLGWHEAHTTPISRGRVHLVLIREGLATR